MAHLYIGFDPAKSEKALELALEFAKIYDKDAARILDHNVVGATIKRIRNPDGEAADRLMEDAHIEMKKYSEILPNVRYFDVCWIEELTA